MPSHICAVPFCQSRKSGTISIHGFPNDVSLRHEWLNSIVKTTGVERYEIGEYSVVCSKHFTEECFHVSKDGRKLLKKGSLPTIFEQPTDAIMMPSTSHGRIFRTSDWAFSDAGYNRTNTEGIVDKSQHVPMMIPVPNLPAEPISDVHTNPVPTPHEQSTHDTVPFNAESSSMIDDNEILLLKNTIRKLKASETYLKNALANKNERLQNLQAQNDQLKVENNKLKNIQDNCKTEDQFAVFLMDQINNFGKKKPHWSEMTIRNCVLWRAKSPKGYFFAKDFLKLPSRSTLERYLGNDNEEIGLTNLIRTRLTIEAEQLSDIEKVCSLIIDDMHIREKISYGKKEDKYFGLDTTTDDPIGERPALANQLMCFVLHGLSTKVTIPAGYFFHKKLTTDKFYELTVKIMKQIHECGFRVLRIVTDNHKSNVALFKKFGEGHLVSEVQHPVTPNMPLFLSFDYCHIIKNARNLFLSNNMVSEKGIITANFVRKLYNLQKNLFVKPVPFLTRRHVMPTNIEKMNVKRAVQLFSPKVTSSIEYLAKYSNDHEDFEESDATIQYMEIMYTFFKLHDVNEETQHIRQNDVLSAPYMNINDERLEWLTNYFPQYIMNIQKYSKQAGFKGLSKETTDAMLVTAESTVKTITFLLNDGFYFVLTRRLNSDSVEALFSQLREGGGFQDATDARAAHYSLRRILKCGIIRSAEGANLASHVLSVGPSIYKQEVSPNSDSIFRLPDDILDSLNEIRSDFGDTRLYGISSASVAMMSGYLLRTIEERLNNCQICLDKISASRNDSYLLGLINLQDRGGLRYPNKEFVSLINIIIKISIQILKLLPRSVHPKQYMIHIFMPYLTECKLFTCLVHKQFVCNLILEKLLNPLLTGIGNTRTDIASNPFPMEIKPLSRKMIKMA